jgi:hypothetical protein
VPAILTLQSGAALAQSSNLIGTVQSASQAIGPDGKVQCLDMASAVGGTPTQLDLGPNPGLHLQYISQRQYYWPNGSNYNVGDPDKPATIEQMCQMGGKFFYKDQGWKPTLAPNGDPIKAGFMLSATALSSFATAIQLKTYF